MCIRDSYHVNGGVNAFDFSDKLTMIVTGGLDALIRLWNPNAVGNKLVGTLEGHASPITSLIVNNLRNQLISIAENKVVDETQLSAIYTVNSREL